MLHILTCAVLHLAVASSIPLGYYSQRLDKFAMQVQVLSVSRCHIEFAFIEANMFFNITDATYSFDPNSHEITLFPSGADLHPAVRAMDAILRLSGMGKLTFPSKGRFLPSEVALQMPMNSVDWKVVRTIPLDLVSLTIPADPASPIYFVGPIYTERLLGRATPIPDAASKTDHADIPSVFVSQSSCSRLLLSIPLLLTILVAM